MILFGDLSSTVPAAAALDRVLRKVREGAHDHTATVDLLLAVGELTQGLLDQAFASRGSDEICPLADEAHVALLAAARVFARSLAHQEVSLAGLERALVGLSAHVPDSDLRLKTGEGFAFHALYPEAYYRAAKALKGLVVTIGIRSVGTSLGAVVAEASTSCAFLTVRPCGDPFDRRLQLGARLVSRLERHASDGATFAIVDEGPGLSGSSFRAVYRVLRALDVPYARIVLFPGHENDPGRQSSGDSEWHCFRRAVVTFDELRARGWPLDAVKGGEDISAGAWRAKVYRREEAWPPVIPTFERRKLLIDRGRAIARFAGLGELGERKWRRAVHLANQGFAPAPIRLAHGFLIERWVPREGIARPASDHVARYLAVLAAMDVEDDIQARLTRLIQMIGHNAGEELARPWRPRLPELARHIRPVWTDGRMHAWEWVRAPGGDVLKTDAVDHAYGPDIVGPQDISWDIAGAELELGLDGDALARQLAELTGGGFRPSRLLLDFYRLAYAVFQDTLWQAAVHWFGAAGRERERIERHRARYVAAIARASSSAPPPG